MNDLLLWVGLIIVVLSIILGFWLLISAFQMTRRVRTWRHRMIFAPSQDEVDQLTNEGWELIEMLDTGEYHFRKED